MGPLINEREDACRSPVWPDRPIDEGAVSGKHLLHHPVFTGRKVIFGGVDEGNPEVEQQVDDKRAGVLRQKDLEQSRQERSEPRCCDKSSPL